MLPRREGPDRCGTVQDEESETGNGPVGYSLFPGMDNHSVDFAFKYSIVCRPED